MGGAIINQQLAGKKAERRQIVLGVGKDGQIDVGPLTIWLGRLSRTLMGDSVFALRFFPAIAGAMTIVDVGLMARELGGGLFAQGLAALAALVAPVWLGA